MGSGSKNWLGISWGSQVLVPGFGSGSESCPQLRCPRKSRMLLPGTSPAAPPAALALPKPLSGSKQTPRGLRDLPLLPWLLLDGPWAAPSICPSIQGSTPPWIHPPTHMGWKLHTGSGNAIHGSFRSNHCIWGIQPLVLARPIQALGDGDTENQDKAKARRQRQRVRAWRVRLHPGGTSRAFRLWGGRSCD